MNLEAAKRRLDNALARKDLVMLVGECKVKYQGRAASNLAYGSRLLLIKGDGSFAIHQNRLLRPTNYLMSSHWSTSLEEGRLIVSATKRNPKETLIVSLKDVEMLQVHTMEDRDDDFKLVGTEKELNDQLMGSLDVLEKGLRPLKQESVLRKGLVDIMAEDTNGNLCVIELKRRQADYNSVMQLQRYVHEVRKQKNAKVRGLLVAPTIGRQALELLKGYGLEYFSYTFDVTQPRVTIDGIDTKQRTIFQALGNNGATKKI
ncbi:MAG: endonuclease NucS [Candidatus Diapherotrites archaeon]|nr:endonuclease NucS [Candidatus Diapherotrites archaeon]MDZ4256780.1 endonuclease NucS [archaeon]